MIAKEIAKRIASELLEEYNLLKDGEIKEKEITLEEVMLKFTVSHTTARHALKMVPMILSSNSIKVEYVKGGKLKIKMKK